MKSSSFLASLAVCILAAVAGAQTIVNTTPAVIGFVDISTTGGTAVIGVDDETEHTFTTTLGNALFPAGPVNLGCNGVVQSGIGTTPSISFSNQTIPAATDPTNIPAGSQGTICAFWDDLDFIGASSTNVYWQEMGGVLYILYKDINAFVGVAGQTITFEIQIWDNPPGGTPWIQILYPDATFGGSQTSHDNAVSATIGWVKGANAIGQNVQWSYNTATIPDGTVLTIYPPMLLGFSSPLGVGSIQVDITSGPPSGTYFLPITFSAGAFPYGWFYGIDITFGDLIGQSAGFPFVGPLGPGGSFTLGPIAGAPPLTLYSVAIGFSGSSLAAVPTLATAPETYTIP